MKIIGLTGLPGSGKETVKNGIFSICAERGLKPLHFSFSDEIKREANARGISGLDRDGISKLVGEMRRNEGSGVLAKRVIMRIEEETADVYVVEALRHPAEAEILSERFGGDFILAAIEVDLRVMAERLIARGRPDESKKAMNSVDDAVKMLEREMVGDGTSVRVGACMKIADITIDNNGTLEDLDAEVRDKFYGILEQQL